MNNLTIWIIIGVSSAIFGIFNRIAVYNERGKSWWFFEWWRDCVSYFIAGIIGYFFVAVRWPIVAKSGNLAVGDYVLGIVFLMGILGWLPYFIKNVTEGISKILGIILDKKIAS